MKSVGWIEVKDSHQLHYSFNLVELVEMLPNGKHELCLLSEAQAEIDDLHAECDRLTACLQWEQHRRDHLGTHGEGCWKWGPEHYECAVRELEWLIFSKTGAKVGDGGK